MKFVFSFRLNNMSTDDLKSDRNDSQSDETYTTPISPLSPQGKSSPPPSVTVVSTMNSNEQSNSVNEMQALIQSSNDLTFPLEDSWTFWYFKNDRLCDWKDNLIKITTISTVESFWSVYNHLQPASRLGQGCDYFLFKTHIVRVFGCLFLTVLIKYFYTATNVGRSIQSFWWPMVFKFK